LHCVTQLKRTSRLKVIFVVKLQLIFAARLKSVRIREFATARDFQSAVSAPRPTLALERVRSAQ